MKKLITLAAIAAGLLMANAQAAVFEFDGATGTGNAIDAPVNGNITTDCGTQGRDLCTVDHTLGFDYLVDGVSVNVTAYGGGALGQDGFIRGDADTLIQDLIGLNQGLGVISAAEGNLINSSSDQINMETGESILFTFASETKITDIFVNDGLGNDCPGGGLEGVCGAIGIIVDGGMLQTFTDFLAAGIIASGGEALELIGTTFEFVSLTPGGGYSIEALTAVPVPGAIPLLISGLAGLGFASRGKKKAA